MFQMLGQEKITTPVIISLHLQRLGNTEQDNGEIRFGGINSALFHDSLVSVPNLSSPYGNWSVAFVIPLYRN
jgi:Eukaryotic aspartyl protease